MRPLLIDLGRDYRGGQHQALLLLQGLRARGHNPELIAVRDSLLARRAHDAGISVTGVERRQRRLGAVLAIRRLMHEKRVDVVHGNEPHALTSAWLARAHRFVPVVAARRIAHPLSSNFLSLARYRVAQRIVAVSHFVEKSVIASGLPAHCIEVIYDGVELPQALAADRDKARNRLAIPPDTLCLGNVAALVPEKGQALLIHALAELHPKFPQCILLLAGKGPEQAGLQDLARELQLRNAVKFAGFVPDIESVYSAIDLFVFPSHEEPLGSALLSAMAHGLPVVALARGGIPEVVEDGRNGLLVKDLDPGALAATLARLLSNPAEARQLGEAARKTVSAHFSADHMVDATFGLYERLLASHSHSLSGRPSHG
jgi:glycosyltransferase involved in cell wall biosynthesis